jgi:molecular chaperone DnaJ
MAEKDFYKILGVGRTASADEIKKAYRKLAMKYHPDRNPDDAKSEQKFKEATEAYEILKDDEKRKMFDQYGSAAFEQGGPGGPGPGAGGFDFGNSGFSDIFDDLFGAFGGGGGARQKRNRGADIRYNMQISLEDAFTGKKQTIKVNTSTPCEKCDGSGSADKGRASTCHTCQGAGKVRMQQGFFTIERACSTCGGNGQVIENPCKKCHGEGRVNKPKTLSINIPAGVEEGTRIRLSGEGEAGVRGGGSGDLYVFISISPHKLFNRDGNDIHCRVPIKMTQAALGGSIEVPTLEGGKAKVTIPAGTQTSNQFRLRGKGMPAMQSSRVGDMYIHTFVETPQHLSKKQKKLLEEFEELSDKKSNPEVEEFLKRAK